MFYGMVPTSFQNREEAIEIRLKISEWVVKRIANASLRGQMNHGIKIPLLKKGGHFGLVGAIHLDEFKSTFGRQLLYSS